TPRRSATARCRGRSRDASPTPTSPRWAPTSSLSTWRGSRDRARIAPGDAMRIALIGQQDFGKAVLDALLARKDEVAGVFCAPEKAGARVDPVRAAAQERGLPVFQFASLRSPEAHDAIRSVGADLGIMAYVLQFAPDSFVKTPRLGTIQYHPSLLPLYRGPSSINWPIIRGD